MAEKLTLSQLESFLWETADPSFDPSKWQFNIARTMVEKRMMKENPVEFRKKKRTLQSHISQYMRTADKHLDNVCEGQFP